MKNYVYRFIAIGYYAFTVGEIVQIVGSPKILRTEPEVFSYWDGFTVFSVLLTFVLVTFFATREYYKNGKVD